MSKLVVNAKLALPGLTILAYSSFFEIELTDNYIPYYKELLASFKRVALPSLSNVLEESWNNNISEDSLASSLTMISALIKALKTDSTTNQSMIELLQHVVGVLKGDNKHYIALRDKISLLGKPEITSLFPIDVDVAKQAAGVAFIEEYDVGKLKELREQKDPEYKKVLAARKQIRTTTSDFIKQFCRGILVPYEVLYKAVEKEQLINSLPEGFEGYIDEFGSLYTVYKVKIDGFPANCKVVMNPQYSKQDSGYVFTAMSPLAKSSTYFYTLDYRKKAKQEKFNVVKKLSLEIGNLRSLWVKKLNIKDKQCEEAILLELIYQTQARIGTPTNATIDKRTGLPMRTYGMSTILLKHYTIESDGSITFSYPGKAAFKGDVIHYQTHKLYPVDTATIFVIDWLSTRKEEKVFSTTAAKVRSLLKELGAPEGATIHKLRTLKGTIMMKECIKQHPFKTEKTSVSAVNKWLKEQALEVGIKLGHMSGEKYTAATAIAHYIDPLAMLKLYKEARVVPPKTMLKLVGIDSNSLEIVR